MDIVLTEPQSQFFNCDAEYVAAVAGFGCVHPDTKIITESGLIRIADITDSTKVLSWDKISNKFIFSRTLDGSFPKGRDHLYEVSTEDGMFAAAPNHRILTLDSDYVRVDDLEIGEELKTCSTSNTLSHTIITSLNQQEDISTYYDMQVVNTNNYITEDGVIHHNSGKTQAATTKIFNTKLTYPSIDIAYLAPSYSLIRDIFFPKIAEMLFKSKIRFNINKTERNIYVQGYGVIICRSMDDPDKLVGWEVGDVILDEFDILPKIKAMAVMDKISARARQKFPDGKKNQKYITTTPEGFKATYQLFKKEPLHDSALIQMSTYSNEHNLPAGFIESRRKQYSSQLIEAYINGQFVNLVAGAVYPYFDRDRNKTSRKIKKGEPLNIGIDFNVGRMSAVVFAPFDGERLEVIGEFFGYADTPALIDAIKERFKGHNIIVFPDAAGKNRNTTGATKTDHKLLKLAGFTVKALKKNPLVKERVQSVNALFEKGFLFINTSVCPEIVECLEQQAYDRNGAPDKESNLDHLLDALGYRICYSWLISRRVINYDKAVA